MNPSMQLVIGLCVTIIATIMNRLGHPISGDLQSYIGDTAAKLVDLGLQFGGIALAAWSHVRSQNTVTTSAPASHTVTTITDPASVAVSGANGTNVTTKIAKLLIIGFTLMFTGSLMGCANPQQTTIREGMNAYATPTFKEYRSMLDKQTAPDTMDETTAHAAGLYTAEDVATRQANIDGFNRLEAQGQALDKQSFLGGVFNSATSQPSSP